MGEGQPVTYVQSDFYDAVAMDQWESLGPAVGRQLAAVAGRPGVVVDLGAGTGLSTIAVARALPDVEILACEPDQGLRGSLVTRILLAGLDDRVTALPWSAQEAVERIDEPLLSVTAFNMIGHLTASDRARVLAWVAAHLAPDGIALIGPTSVHEPTESHAEAVPFGERRIGRLTYATAGRAEVSPGRGTRWHMSWTVRLGAETIDERHAVFDWSAGAPEGLLDEVRSAGPAAEILRDPSGTDLLVARGRHTP